MRRRCTRRSRFLEAPRWLPRSGCRQRQLHLTHEPAVDVVRICSTQCATLSTASPRACVRRHRARASGRQLVQTSTHASLCIVLISIHPLPPVCHLAKSAAAVEIERDTTLSAAEKAVRRQQVMSAGFAPKAAAPAAEKAPAAADTKGA